jgi:hypothetical protein
MSAPGNCHSWREHFPASEIPFILSGVLRCMAGERKKTEVEGENSISVRLWKKLRLDADLRQRPVQSDPEAWEINENNPDGVIGRLDIRFIYSTGVNHPWPVFAIEAKRLHVNFTSGWKSLISEYVTAETAKPLEKEQGMMCFVTGRYSKGLRAGAMLGYVFDGNIIGARASIAEAIEKYSTKLKLKTGATLSKSSLIAGQTELEESLHALEDEKLDDKNPFTIYHILVSV